MDPGRRLRLLRQHIATDRLLGVDVMPIAWTQPAPAATTPPAPTTTPIPAHATPAHPTPAAPRPAAPRATTIAPPPSPPNPPAPAVGSAPAVPLRVLSTSQKTDLLAEMDAAEVTGCTRCDLHRGRTQTVFGEGDVDTPLMFIGEGPGEQEDAVGRPFVGRSGELLDKMIVAMGLSRERVYIANCVKCRPPGNRTPTPDEVQTCGDYLRRQVAIIQPRVIVTLGGPAAQLVLGTRQGITRIRGTWGEYRGTDPATPVMPTFHPAFLLRSYTVENRKKVWADLQEAMTRLTSDR